jgi:hypothetical protein
VTRKREKKSKRRSQWINNRKKKWNRKTRKKIILSSFKLLKYITSHKEQ